MNIHSVVTRIISKAACLVLLFFVLLNSLPVSSHAADETAPIRLGYLQNIDKIYGCGTSLYFSRDYKANHLSKEVFATGFHMIPSDNPLENFTHDKDVVVMHLDGKDRYFTKDSEISTKDSEGKLLYERLKFHGDDYKLHIKWIFFDSCNQNNEDCEVAGLRAYIDIYRGAAIRHVRLFGLTGC